MAPGPFAVDTFHDGGASELEWTHGEEPSFDLKASTRASRHRHQARFLGSLCKP
jgi:hypothetical protein